VPVRLRVVEQVVALRPLEVGQPRPARDAAEVLARRAGQRELGAVRDGRAARALADQDQLPDHACRRSRAQSSKSVSGSKSGSPRRMRLARLELDSMDPSPPHSGKAMSLPMGRVTFMMAGTSRS